MPHLAHSLRQGVVDDAGHAGRGASDDGHGGRPGHDGRPPGAHRQRSLCGGQLPGPGDLCRHSHRVRQHCDRPAACAIQRGALYCLQHPFCTTHCQQSAAAHLQSGLGCANWGPPAACSFRRSLLELATTASSGSRHSRQRLHRGPPSKTSSRPGYLLQALALPERVGVKGAIIQGLSVGSINGLFPCAWALVRLLSGLQTVQCCVA